jgi:hypothetical protein
MFSVAVVSVACVFISFALLLFAPHHLAFPDGRSIDHDIHLVLFRLDHH